MLVIIAQEKNSILVKNLLQCQLALQGTNRMLIFWIDDSEIGMKQICWAPPLGKNVFFLAAIGQSGMNINFHDFSVAGFESAIKNCFRRHPWPALANIGLCNMNLILNVFRVVHSEFGIENYFFFSSRS